MKSKILLVIVIIAGLVQYGCKKNDSGSDGPPMITNVRAVDSTKRDSSFTQALPGTLIVIQGNNLGGLQAVYFNDTSAYFNPSYATSTNIIVNIPASAQTAATNPDVPNMIKVVTDHGTVTYGFTLYLYPPSISSISLDNSGTLVYINGYNLAGINKVTFPVPGIDTALSYTVNKTFTQITAVIPPGSAFKDSIRVYGTFGKASYVYPPPMTITSISNENGAAGTTITITGTNLIAITKILFPGGIEGTNIESNSVSKVSVTVPAGITAPDSLRLFGALGTISSPQRFATYITHPSPGYLSTFEAQYGSDNTGFVGWTGGYADEATTTANYPGGTGASSFLLQASPMDKNSGVGTQGNAGWIQLNQVPWVSNTALMVKDYSLKFEVYVKNSWSAGAIWILMGDWYGWKDSYMARYAPWTSEPSGKFQPSGWVTATIPLTQFVSAKGNEWDLKSFPTGSPATTFSNYPVTSLCFAIANDMATAIPANTLNIAIDNVRIVKGQ